jgi:hypothetical protein
VKLAIEKAKQFKKAVITDVRFPNEAEAIKENGGVVMMLVRDTGAAYDYHSSEAIDNIVSDYFIDNRGTLKELKHSLIAVALEYERGY